MAHCGYINLLFGSFRYNIIYLFCGMYGHMISCMVDSTEMYHGSSTSILGVFGAWLVWIIYRW